MDYEKTLIIIQETVDELIEENIVVPVLVEGIKDVKALRKLGLKGKIIQLNRGASVTNFCDQIARGFKTVILLTDWDKKGGYLFGLIKKNLKGRVFCNTKYRDIFAQHSIVRTIEGLPAWISTLKEKIDET